MPAHPHFLWQDLFRKSSQNRSGAKEGIIQVLKDNILFRGLSGAELKYISNFVYERHYQTGEPIFHQGDRGVGMYMIGSGKVAITTEGLSSEHFVTELLAGSFLGEIALVDPDSVRTATILAVEPTTLIGFFKPDLMEIVARRPATGVKILMQLSEVIGRRLVETTEKITRMKCEEPAPGRGLRRVS